MDCMYDQETTKTCFNQSQCLMKYTNDQKQFLHCCCDQHLCNLNFNLSDPEPVSMTSNDLHEKNVCQGRVCHRTFWLILVVFGLILSVLFLLISFICRKYFIGNLKKCRKSSRSPATHTNGSVANPSETSPFLIENQFELNSNSIEVGNLFKRGRFSQLDKGLYKNQQVALKTFANEPQSTTLFDNEKFIYSLISIQHKNILKYFGFTRSPTMRLVFEYCCNGSLKEYLNSNIISNESELLNMLKELSEGLHFLHKDFRNENENKRAPIAHRDLKSENILFFNSNRLVICDFAMSTQIQQYQYGSNHQQQVGTPRYMSPEILVSTIGCEEGSLLKCDVYALGIIFWEVLSRFDFQISHVNKYKLPFEDQLKEYKLNVNNPTVKEMNIIIDLCQPNNRPLIDSNWDNDKLKSYSGIISILNACWNQNPDLRIQAGVVLNRINSIIKDFHSSK